MGILAGESLLRRNSYLKRGGCNVLQENKSISSHPLSIWTEEDVWTYIRRYNLPYAEIYNHIDRTGCAFCGFGCTRKDDRRFDILYELYPRMYEVCMNYQNSGYTYRQALQTVGVFLPDEKLKFT